MVAEYSAACIFKGVLNEFVVAIVACIGQRYTIRLVELMLHLQAVLNVLRLVKRSVEIRIDRRRRERNSQCVKRIVDAGRSASRESALDDGVGCRRIGRQASAAAGSDVT